MRRKYTTGILFTPKDATDDFNELKDTGRYGNDQILLRAAVKALREKIFGEGEFFDWRDGIEKRLAELEKLVRGREHE